MITNLILFAAAHLSLLVEAVLTLAILRAFVRAERRGRSVSVVLTALGVVVLDAALYPGTAATQLISVFHPSAGGQTVRLSQIVIAFGVIARLYARGMPRRVQPVALLWLGFFLWYATASVTGIMHGYDSHLVLSRGMLVLEAGGMMLLCSGVAPADYLENRGLPRFVVLSGALAGIIFVMAEAGIRITASLPHLPLLDFGLMGSDAATIFSAIGIIGFGVELSRRHRRPLVLIASTVLVMAFLASPQRAARLGVAVTLVLLLVAVVWPRRRRLRARSGDLVLIITCAVAIVAGTVFMTAVFSTPQSSVSAAIPFSKYNSQAVSSSYRTGSVQSRFNEWDAALPLIRAEPLVGNGVGKTFLHYDVGTNTFIEYDITNNIFLDLLLRTGAVGLVLYLLAIGGTFASAWRVWRRSVSDQASIMAVTVGAVLGGFIAKGMVESVLNEFHLTPLFGFLVGLILALAGAERPVGTARAARNVALPVTAQRAGT